jgi:hypothetical protein
MVNQLKLEAKTASLTTGATAQKVQDGVSLLKYVLIQNLATEEVTIGSKEALQVGDGIILAAASGAGKAGGSLELKAPEDLNDAYIDISNLYFVATTSGSEIAIFTMAWTPIYPTGTESGNVVHKFYGGQK